MFKMISPHDQCRVHSRRYFQSAQKLHPLAAPIERPRSVVLMSKSIEFKGAGIKPLNSIDFDINTTHVGYVLTGTNIGISTDIYV